MCVGQTGTSKKWWLNWAERECWLTWAKYEMLSNVNQVPSLRLTVPNITTEQVGYAGPSMSVG